MKNSYEDRREVYEQAIAVYGEEAQLWIVIEEISELQKEICKYMRGKHDFEAIADEIADVTIMLEQAQLIFGISKADIDSHMAAKVERLKNRMTPRW